MGKTILELFKTQKLANGKTAQQTYDIQDVKQNKPESASGLMNATAFPLQQIARRNLSARLSETRLEEETTGLRILKDVASPIIYGTDIIRLTKQTTKVATVMLDAANGGTSQTGGILDNLIAKAETKGLDLLNKIGVELPENLIPTRVATNQKFKDGKISDLYTTIAEIKKDGAGNVAGQFLAKNAKGTINQIGGQVLGSGIQLIKDTIKAKLTSARKEGQQLIAKNKDGITIYDNTLTYSSTIDVRNTKITDRNDLSSIVAQSELTKQSNDIQSKVRELIKNPPVVGSIPEEDKPIDPEGNPFAATKDKVKSAIDNGTKKLLASGKENQQALANGKKIGDLKDGAIVTDKNSTINYEGTVDPSNDDITLRNDLSSKYKSIYEPTAVKAEKIKYSIDKQSYPGSAKDVSGFTNDMELKRGLTSNQGDYLNTIGAYKGDAKDAKGNTLESYDFIPLKFTSVQNGLSVNFRATITGLTETFSPSWDTHKFLGSPFPFYTYTQIERSVAFNFKIYSQNGAEHKAAWERIAFLSSLVYPQGYSTGTGVFPPIIRLTLGDMYSKKLGFIESLSYTIDDSYPWEIGLNSGDLANYKLPQIIDVAVTIKILQNRSTTDGVNLYGFSDKVATTTDFTNNQKINKTGTTTVQPKASTGFKDKGNINTTAAAGTNTVNTAATTATGTNSSTSPTTTAVNNLGDIMFGQSLSVQKDTIVPPATEPTQIKPPNYTFKAFTSGNDIVGQIYADGTLIEEKNYYSYYSYTNSSLGGTNIDLKGEPAVLASMKNYAKIFGIYSDITKQMYKPNPNIS